MGRRAHVAFAVLLWGAIGCGGSGGSTSDDEGTGADVASDSSGDDASDVSPDTPDPDADDDASSDVGAPDAPTDVGTSCPSEASDPFDIVIDSGVVRGTTVDESVAWLGIPYVAPPVGDLRWEPPQPAECLPAPAFVADAFGPMCPQTNLGGSVVGEEDCLTLNVWAPTGDPPAGGWPVMVFVHGGGNVQGSSSVPLQAGGELYDGRFIAGGYDTVVVTLNYRLGPLGFLALSELTGDGSVAGSGNYGVLDQIEALRWVQRNIEAFGGDPDTVMLFGESAGAVNTMTHIASPMSAGLFHRAALQSGSTLGIRLADAESAGQDQVSGSACASVSGDALMDCLRDLSFADVIDQMGGSVGIGNPTPGSGIGGYGPVIDGHVLVNDTATTILAGEHNSVPLIVGHNAEELAQLLIVGDIDESEYENLVRTSYGIFGTEAVDRMLELYPAADYDSPRDALVQLTSDARFTCPAQRTAQFVADNQEAPVYRYLFRRRTQTRMGENPAAHGVELIYVFQTYGLIPLYSPAPGDANTAELMTTAWTSFALDGSPSVPAGAPSWPEYDTSIDNVFVLDDPAEVIEGLKTEECAFWNDLF